MNNQHDSFPSDQKEDQDNHKKSKQVIYIFLAFILISLIWIAWWMMAQINGKS